MGGGRFWDSWKVQFKNHLPQTFPFHELFIAKETSFHNHQSSTWWFYIVLESEVLLRTYNNLRALLSDSLFWMCARKSNPNWFLSSMRILCNWFPRPLGSWASALLCSVWSYSLPPFFAVRAVSLFWIYFYQRNAERIKILSESSSDFYRRKIPLWGLAGACSRCHLWQFNSLNPC